MRRNHCRTTSAIVTQALCELAVSHLALTDWKRCLPANLLARLLLLASALGRSLSFVAQRCSKAPSDEALRLAVLFNLPGQDLLQARLLSALHSLLPRRLKDASRPAALDYHSRPFYGDKDTPGVRGGKREAGTRWFWTFATLAVLSRGLRHTIAFCHVAPGETQERVVCRLLAQAARSGVRLRYLLMDRAFHDAAVLALLQERGIPFVVPMRRRGDEAKGSGTAPFFKPKKCGGWESYSWTARPRRWDEAKGRMAKAKALTVTVAVCVVARGGRKGPAVFAAWRIRWSPFLVRKRYRSRFGIETGYRQLGEVLAATTSKDVRVRMLLVGLALLVRQYWCLQTEDAALARRGRKAWLRFAELAAWIEVELLIALGFRMELVLSEPDDPGRTAA